MIKSTAVTVTISNNKKYYEGHGYSNLKSGVSITVPIELLPDNSNKIVDVDCDDCDTGFKRSIQLLRKKKTMYSGDLCIDCARIAIGKNMDTSGVSSSNSRRIGTKHPLWRVNKTELRAYTSKVRTKTAKTLREHDLNPENKLIGRCGIPGAHQIDHKISIKTGFEKNIDPNILGSVENLQLLTWEDNRKKWHTNNVADISPSVLINT